jgi:lipoprotein-anchoring transpeptidase ErfK/SrfK
MRNSLLYAVFCLLLLGSGQNALAEILIKVDRTEQMMRVYEYGELVYVWPVSTGRRGYTTPTGSFQPYSLRRHHRSGKYHGAPMPYSIFYRGGFAIHGTKASRRLGRTASHGCIRLHMDNARELFEMVRHYGKDATQIIVHR